MTRNVRISKEINISGTNMRRTVTIHTVKPKQTLKKSITDIKGRSVKSGNTYPTVRPNRQLDLLVVDRTISLPEGYLITDETAKTTLNGAINASVTTITLTDATLLDTYISAATGHSVGSDRPGFIKIDDEIIKYTAVSGNNLTCIRGFGGSTAASHIDGTNVYHPAYHYAQSLVWIMEDGGIIYFVYGMGLSRARSNSDTFDTTNVVIGDASDTKEVIFSGNIIDLSIDEDSQDADVSFPDTLKLNLTFTIGVDVSSSSSQTI